MTDYFIKEIITVFALWFVWYRRYIYNQDNTVVSEKEWSDLKKDSGLDFEPYSLKPIITSFTKKSTRCKGCGGNTGNKDTCQYCLRGI